MSDKIRSGKEDVRLCRIALLAFYVSPTLLGRLPEPGERGASLRFAQSGRLALA